MLHVGGSRSKLLRLVCVRFTTSCSLIGCSVRSVPGSWQGRERKRPVLLWCASVHFDFTAMASGLLASGHVASWAGNVPAWPAAAAGPQPNTLGQFALRYRQQPAPACVLATHCKSSNASAAAAAPLLSPDEVHPQDRTGHWALADLLVTLTQVGCQKCQEPC